MRKINTHEIYKATKQMALTANCNVNNDVVLSLEKAFDNESNQTAKFALQTILQNDKIASEQNIPACQDTGMAVVFCEIGQIIGHHVAENVILFLHRSPGASESTEPVPQIA